MKYVRDTFVHEPSMSQKPLNQGREDRIVLVEIQNHQVSSWKLPQYILYVTMHLYGNLEAEVPLWVYSDLRTTP